MFVQFVFFFIVIFICCFLISATKIVTCFCHLCPSTCTKHFDLLLLISFLEKYAMQLLSGHSLIIQNGAVAIK